MQGETNWGEHVFEGIQDSCGFFSNLGPKPVSVHSRQSLRTGGGQTRLRMKPSGKGPAQLWVQEAMLPPGGT